jgi:hypothetical protein
MLCQDEYAAAIVRDKVIGLPRFCHRQKRIIGRICSAIHTRQFFDYQCFGSQRVDESSCIGALDKRREPRPTTYRFEFFQLLFGTDELEALLGPGINQASRCAVLRDQRTDEHVRIQDDSHVGRDLLALRTKTFGANLGQGFLNGLLD